MYIHVWTDNLQCRTWPWILCGTLGLGVSVICCCVCLSRWMRPLPGATTIFEKLRPRKRCAMLPLPSRLHRTAENLYRRCDCVPGKAFSWTTNNCYDASDERTASESTPTIHSTPSSYSSDSEQNNSLPTVGISTRPQIHREATLDTSEGLGPPSQPVGNDGTFHPTLFVRSPVYEAEPRDSNDRGECSGEGVSCDIHCMRVPRELQQSQSVDTFCFVCLDQGHGAVLMECGHGGLCVQCASTLWARGVACRRCPMCRAEIAAVMRVVSRTPRWTYVEPLHFSSTRYSEGKDSELPNHSRPASWLSHIPSITVAWLAAASTESAQAVHGGGGVAVDLVTTLPVSRTQDENFWG